MNKKNLFYSIVGTIWIGFFLIVPPYIQSNISLDTQMRIFQWLGYIIIGGSLVLTGISIYFLMGMLDESQD